MSTTVNNNSSYAAALAAATSSGSDTSSTSALPQQNLGQSDFLKLLTVQLQQQDPMKPMSDTDFIAQMAQFSSLQEMQTMTGQMSRLTSSQDLASANSYIGRNVLLNAGDGTTLTGKVTGVEIHDDGPRIVVGDYSYPLSAVQIVEPVTVAETSPATDSQS